MNEIQPDPIHVFRDHFLTSFRTKFLALFLGLITAIILTGCSGSSSPATQTGQPAPQTQAPAQQPTHTSLPNDTQAPANTQATAPTAAEAAGSGLSACGLVTKEEAGAAVGSPVGDPVEEDYPPQYTCKYEASGFDSVSIDMIVYDDPQQANEAFQMEIDINNYTEVSGIGDRALRPSPIMDITVIKGKYELSIDVVNDSDEEAQFEQAKNLAMNIVGRLP